MTTNNRTEPGVCRPLEKRYRCPSCWQRFYFKPNLDYHMQRKHGTVQQPGVCPEDHEAYVRPCTCHPDDNPPVPCAQQYALNECRAKALGDAPAPCAWRRPMNANLAGFSTDGPVEQRRRDAALFTPGGYVSEEGSMNESPALESALAKLRECAATGNETVAVKVFADQCAALLAKIEAADRLEWQPIETAPKDGAEFQAWLLDAGRQHGWWEPRCRFNDDGAFQVWQRVDYDDDGWDVIEARPTHWLPKPTEPAAYRNPQPAGGGE